MPNNTRAHQNLVRRILRASGPLEDVFLVPNEVGQGFYGAIEPQLYNLSKKGPEALFAGYRQVLYRNRVVYGMGVGSPDIVGHVGGIFLTGECKTGGADLSDEQIVWRDVERQRGAIVETWRDVNDFLADVEVARRRAER